MGDAQPLVGPEWLAARLDDPSTRIVHVAVEPAEASQDVIPGAIFSDLHVDLARAGTRSETGPAPRQYLLPTLEETVEVLARWGVGPNDHLVLYDKAGQNRFAARGYWLLRLYRFPAEWLHLLDGGMTAWLAAGLATQRGAAVATPVERGVAAAQLGPLDQAILATSAQMEELSREAASASGRGAATILDVRSLDEYLGHDVRARRGGRIPGARHTVFTEFVGPDNRLRPAADVLAILRGAGVEPSEVSAVYCQGGVRAALGWFVLHEVAGLDQVRNYAQSWEEWGNLADSPIEK